MGIEALPQAAAVVLAAGGAVTDALRGKIYNRWLAAGLAAALAWLVVLPVFNALGGDAEWKRYSELGLWTRDAGEGVQVGQEGAAPATTTPGGPAPWEAAGDVSVWPPPEGGVPAPGGDDAPAPVPSFGVYLAKVAANAGLALLAGFLMWWFGLWAAGDAKMFAVLALLLPLSTYRGAYLPAFPAYVLLFNTFVAVMALLVVEMVARIARQTVRPTEDEAQVARETAAWVRSHAGELALGFVGMFFLFLVIKTLRGLFRDVLVDWTHLDVKPAIYLALLLVFHPVVRAMRDRRVLVPVALLTAGYIAYVAARPTKGHDLASVLSVGGVAGSVMVFYLLYGIYLNVFDFKAVRVWELKPRMILSRRTLEVLKEDQDLLDHKMGPVGPDGLSPDQVEVLRRWWIDRGKGGVVWVSRTFPFAPALFVGTLVTVWLGSYVVWT